MHSLTQEILFQLKAKANATNAKAMKAYMLHQFDFFGVKTPDRRIISKEVFSTIRLKSYEQVEQQITQLWQLPQRECHYIAIELLAFYKKILPIHSIELIEKLLVTNSWWDSVDNVASYVFPFYFKTYPEQIIPVTKIWNESNILWLQRSSIMFQKAAKANTNTELLSQYILRHTDSQEFFIRKAIGWALREYAKTNPTWVLNFAQHYKTKLSTLSYKEAIRNIAP